MNGTLLCLTGNIRRTIALLSPRMLWKLSALSSTTREESILSSSDRATLHRLIGTYDDDTYVHARRTGQLAEALARYLKFSQQEILLTYLAALLHDIGKTGVPRAIVQKSGPLSDEEWAIMRLHTQIGQDILMRAGGIFVQLAPIVAAHHERWDGQGYPRGLRYEEIPPVARLLAVVDSYDAMLSSRTYQRGLSIDATCGELYAGAGSQYDPRVVTAFLCMNNAQSSPTTELFVQPPFVPLPAKIPTSPLL